MDIQKTDVLQSKNAKKTVEIQLVEQIDLTITGKKVWYKILIDGNYLSSSLTDKKFEAMKLYERIIKNGGDVQENIVVASAIIEKEALNAK